MYKNMTKFNANPPKSTPLKCFLTMMASLFRLVLPLTLAPKDDRLPSVDAKLSPRSCDSKDGRISVISTRKLNKSQLFDFTQLLRTKEEKDMKDNRFNHCHVKAHRSDNMPYKTSKSVTIT